MHNNYYHAFITVARPECLSSYHGTKILIMITTLTVLYIAVGIQVAIPEHTLVTPYYYWSEAWVVKSNPVLISYDS